MTIRSTPPAKKEYYILYPIDGPRDAHLPGLDLGQQWEATYTFDHLPTVEEIVDAIDAEGADSYVLVKVESIALLKSGITIGEFK